ncbi:MAG: lysylphosphatidylglycerol synthase transmembrane domain-containing protein [Thiobacillaceae bacterium]
MSIIGVGLALAAPFVLGGSTVLNGLRNVGPQMFMMLAGFAVISGVAKAGKLQILLVSLGSRLPLLRTLAITFVTDFAFLSSPAGAAGYVTNVTLLKAAGTSWAVSTTVVGAEQALDFVFFAVALPAAAVSAVVPLAQWVPALPRSAYGILVTGALFALAGLWWSRHVIGAALHKIVCVVPWFRARQERIGEFVSEFRKQISTLNDAPVAAKLALLLLTVVQWITRYGVLWLVLLQLGYHVPFGFLLVLQAVVLHLAQWTGVPAGGGSADLGLAAALAPWLLGSTMATALLLWRFSTLYFPLMIGALSVVVLTAHWRTLPIATPETRS